MSLIARVLATVVGIAVVVWVLDAAVRTFMLPRASRVKLTRWVGNVVWWCFRMLTPKRRSYEWRDKVLAIRPPITLLVYQATWLTLVFVGFAFVFYGVDEVPLADATRESGSALFTLGFAAPPGDWSLGIVYVEAFIGLTLLALLISYLPTIYAAFQKREFQVSKLAVRAGKPPRAWHAIAIAHRTASHEWVDENTWGEWEDWFIDLAESHTSLVILNTYRSPDPDNHFLSAAECIMDFAALRIAVVDVEVSVGASVVIRSGVVAMQTLARYFRVPFPENPQPDDPISITREQFDAACAYMSTAGVPLKTDLDQAWRDFAGWRVNYDAIIVQAAATFDIPESPWLTATEQAPAFPP